MLGSFIIGIIVGAIGIVAICCCIASGKDREDWE